MLRETKLFVFDANFLPKEWKEVHFEAAEQFFLPFQSVFVEDTVSGVLLWDFEPVLIANGAVSRYGKS